MSSSALSKPLARLRSQMLRTARGFHDYNFRQYFVQHVKDDFLAVAKLPVEQQEAFLKKDGVAQLHQLQRMVTVNRLYGRESVFFDKKKGGKAMMNDSKKIH